MKRRIPLSQAQRLADDFLTAIRPFCERAADVFRVLGLDFIPPAERKPLWWGIKER